MLVSEAPCVQAMTLMPLRPSVPNSLPAMPGVCFMSSPTTAIVARSCSAVMLPTSPISISGANSLVSIAMARSASSLRSPIDVVFSEAACDTKKTLMPALASVRKMRWLTPITPTMPSP